MRESEIIICPVCEKGNLEFLWVDSSIPLNANEEPTEIYTCDRCMRIFIKSNGED